MKRVEFLEQLKNRLNRLPDDELKNVLDYYNEIFLDAGEENEEKTAEYLGNIDDIARQIYFDNNIAPDGKPEFIMDEAAYKKYGENSSSGSRTDDNPHINSGMSVSGKILLIILLFPIWFPILAAVSAVLFSVAITFIAIGFGLGISGAALTAAGIVIVFTAPPIGIFTAGAGLIILSLGLFIAKPLFKSVWRGFASFLNWLVSKAHGIFADRRSV